MASRVVLLVRSMGRLAAVICVTALPAALAAQAPATLVGAVRDSAGKPIAGVEVRLDRGAIQARTNDSGAFRLKNVPPGRTRVYLRRLGFVPASTDITLHPGIVDSLAVGLSMSVASLPGVLVEDEATTRSHQLLPGFWDRRSQGFGHFLTREDIERRQTSNFVDLVRLVPSANVLVVNGRTTIRLKRWTTSRDCPPQYWVDGMRVEQATPDEFSPDDLEAVEIYAGPATIPVQFAPRPYSYTCGAIVIWTRLPGN